MKLIEEILFTEETLNEIKGVINLVSKVIYVAALIILGVAKLIQKNVKKASRTLNQENEIKQTPYTLVKEVIKNETNENNTAIETFPCDIEEYGHTGEDAVFYPVEKKRGEYGITIEQTWCKIYKGSNDENKDCYGIFLPDGEPVQIHHHDYLLEWHNYKMIYAKETN